MSDEEEEEKEEDVRMIKEDGLIQSADISVVTKFVTVLKSRYFWRSLLLGQLMSVLLCGTAVTSGLLADRGIHIPTAQNFSNYVLLCLIFTTRLAYRQVNRNIVLCLKKWWWKYFLISVADVEANYLIIKAYSYTTVTSAQLLTCFSTLVVVVLSVTILRVKYRLRHYAGVAICILGLGGLVLTDFLSGNSDQNASEASNRGLGDVLCIAGASLYGFSNIAEEYVVKHYDRTEFLGMIGLFGSFINGIQFVLLERNELAKLTTWSYEDALLIIGFAACQFLIYTCMTFVIQKTSATTVNISMLSSNFYTLLFGLFLFKYQFHVLYFVCFGVIIVGVGIYASQQTETQDKDLPHLTKDGSADS